MPGRPRQHELETESYVAFRNMLPSAWTDRRVENNDYGVDLEVELFENRVATGLTFKVQLKGTDNALRKGRTSLSSIKRATLNYWRSLDVPVLVILFVAPTGALYARWAHSFDDHYSKDPNSKTVTFVFRTEDRLDDAWLSRLPAEARFIRNVTQGKLRPPLRIAFSPSNGRRGHSDERLRAELRQATRQSHGLAEITDPGIGVTDLTISDSEIRLVLPTSIRSATLHATDSPADQSVRAVVSDVMICVAHLYACIGDTGSAERLIRVFGDTSDALRHSPFLRVLVDTFFEADNASMMYFLIEPWIDSDDVRERRVAEMVLVRIHCMAGHIRLSANELDRMIERTRHRAKIEKGEGRGIRAGRTLYNLGEANRAIHQYERALELFDEAVVLDPSYARRGYFWRARGAMHFALDRLDAAEADYRRAIACDDTPESPLLLSDVLMHAGRFADALDVQLREDVDDYYALGERINRKVLHTIVHYAGVSRQTRALVPEETLADLQRSPGKQSILDAIQAYDALDRRLWRLLFSNLTEQLDEALKALTVLADIVRSEPRIWAFAACVAVAVEAPDSDIDDLCDSGMRWCDAETDFLDALERLRPGDDGDVPDFVQGARAKAYSRAQAERPRWPRVIRKLTKDGSYEVWEIP